MTDIASHPVFGQLRWESEYSWWHGEARFLSGVVTDLHLVPGDDDGEIFLGVAASLYCRVIEDEVRLRGQAVEQGILELHCQWRNDDEPQLSAEVLADRLEPMFLRIDTYATTPVTLSYALGERNDVFGGHAVDVMVDEALQVKRVLMVG